MTSYGFGKKTPAPVKPADETRLDLSEIVRAPLSVDPIREAAAMARGDALGFVDRGDQAVQKQVGEAPNRTCVAGGRRPRREASISRDRRRRLTGSSSSPTNADTAHTGKRSPSFGT